jgi:hypothetical protein
MRKISNKRLSRNLKTRKIPLRVLPLAPFHKRYRLNHSAKKQERLNLKAKQVHSPAVQCTVEKVIRKPEKSVKKSSGKKQLTIKPILSLHGTLSALRWFLLLVLIYLAAGITVVMIQDGTEILKNIIIYSIMGFFTFFMGYLGWILARDVLDIVSGKKQTDNKAEL